MNSKKKLNLWQIITLVAIGVLALVSAIFGILAANGVFDEPEPVIHQLNLSRETRLAFNAYANYLYDGEITTTTFDTNRSMTNTALSKMAQNKNSEERQAYFTRASDLQNAFEQASYRDHPYTEDNPVSPVYTFQTLAEDLRQSMIITKALVAPSEPTDAEMIDFLRDASVEVTLSQIMRRYTDLVSVDGSLYDKVNKYYTTYLILLDVYMANGCVSDADEIDTACTYRISSSSPKTLANYQSAKTNYLLARENTISTPLRLCIKLANLVNVE